MPLRWVPCFSAGRQDPLLTACPLGLVAQEQHPRAPCRTCREGKAGSERGAEHELSLAAGGPWGAGSPASWPSALAGCFSHLPEGRREGSGADNMTWPAQRALEGSSWERRPGDCAWRPHTPWNWPRSLGSYGHTEKGTRGRRRGPICRLSPGPASSQASAVSRRQSCEEDPRAASVIPLPQPCCLLGQRLAIWT